MWRSLVVGVTVLLCLLSAALPPRVIAQQTEESVPLPGTALLQLDVPLDVAMVQGINAFADRELQAARISRSSRLTDAFDAESARAEFRRLTGAVDPRSPPSPYGFQAPVADDAVEQNVTVLPISWPVMEGVTGEGLMLKPHGPLRGFVVALPDASMTPEEYCGLLDEPTSAATLPMRLAAAGCLVVVPVLIDRNDTWSGHDDIRYTNLPHREFIYRMAFELGRHIIGYELQRILAAVDTFDAIREAQQSPDLPIGICGYGDGGMLSLYAAALDTRITACMVSGYLDDRTAVWQEPIDRNVWRLLTRFSDAELCRCIVPRKLVIDTRPAIPFDGPPAARKGRGNYAAPGRIAAQQSPLAAAEVTAIRQLYDSQDAREELRAFE
jgi:hypothetical protein